MYRNIVRAKINLLSSVNIFVKFFLIGFNNMLVLRVKIRSFHVTYTFDIYSFIYYWIYRGISGYNKILNIVK